MQVISHCMRCTSSTPTVSFYVSGNILPKFYVIFIVCNVRFALSSCGSDFYYVSTFTFILACCFICNAFIFQHFGRLKMKINRKISNKTFCFESKLTIEAIRYRHNKRQKFYFFLHHLPYSCCEKKVRFTLCHEKWSKKKSKKKKIVKQKDTEIVPGRRFLFMISIFLLSREKKNCIGDISTVFIILLSIHSHLLFYSEHQLLTYVDGSVPMKYVNVEIGNSKALTMRKSNKLWIIFIRLF